MAKIYDVAGVGIGPFNLGLAALAHDIRSLNCIFFDSKPAFKWHEGIMIKGATLQVPFYADLVTLVNPESPFTFLSYLKCHKKMFRFAIRESIPTRFEYNHYCKWVASRLPSLCFSQHVSQVTYEKRNRCYKIQSNVPGTKITTVTYAKRIVIGIGTSPYIPKLLNQSDYAGCIHSSEYILKKDALLKAKSICIVGSGQSAAEIFQDLFPHHKKFSEGMHWITKSERFFPMDYSKLSLEFTSPDFIDSFYKMSIDNKTIVNTRQTNLYKGINSSLINDIYDNLYQESLYEPLNHIKLRTNYKLIKIDTDREHVNTLVFVHQITGKQIVVKAGAIVFATGYQYEIPGFIKGIEARINFDADGRYNVNRNYSIDINGNEVFVQNAELHTHGFSAPDLGMGPYRNATILNNILGYQHYELETDIAFQLFE